MDVVGFVIGRCFISAGFAMVQIASPQLLLRVNNGDFVATQKTLNFVQTATTVVAFFLRPYVGAFIDSFGRKPAIVGGALLSAIARSAVAAYPTNFTYIIYRIVNMFSILPIFYGVTAYLSDKYGGRASMEYIEFNRLLRVLESLSRIVFVRVAARIKDCRNCFFLAAAGNLGAVIIFMFTMKETLKREDKQKFKVKSAGNPFKLIEYFTRSRKLQWLAAVLLLTNIPMQNQTLDMYRRQKFGWTAKESALMFQIFNVCQLLSPFIALEIYKRIGAEMTFICSQLAELFCSLNTSFTFNARTLYLNPLVASIFDQEAATNVLVVDASSTSPIGQGRLSAAIMSLSFPLGLIFPTVYGELYARSLKLPLLKGNLPFIASALLQGFNAFVVLPHVFREVFHVKTE